MYKSYHVKFTGFLHHTQNAYTYTARPAWTQSSMHMLMAMPTLFYNTSEPQSIYTMQTMQQPWLRSCVRVLNVWDSPRSVCISIIMRLFTWAKAMLVALMQQKFKDLIFVCWLGSYTLLILKNPGVIFADLLNM